MSEPNTYQIVTMKDVFDKVPTDSIRACMNELAKGMTCVKSLGELSGATMNWPESIDWVDDDKGEIDVCVSAGGEPVFTLKTRPIAVSNSAPDRPFQAMPDAELADEIAHARIYAQSKDPKIKASLRPGWLSC